MVTDRPLEAALTLPATSVALAVMLWVPSARVEAVMVHVPPVAMPVPITVVPSNRLTVLPASAVPVKVGVVTLVMLSVLDTPLSDAATRSGLTGRGAVVSMVTDKAAEAALTLPATSVALAVMLWVPSARVERGDGPGPGRRGDAGADPVVPSNSVTVLPASAVPVKVGVVTLVMLSVLRHAAVRRREQIRG